jgi:DNA transposition AAA+ family ATPase
MLTQENIKKIIDTIKIKERNYPSSAKFAVAMGISGAQLSKLKKQGPANVVSEQKLIQIARKLNVQLGESYRLKAAKTPVFQYISAQLENCQANAISGLLCDSADIGKTFTAKHYASTHKNAVYIDCSQYKNKQRFIRAIARELGLFDKGRYQDIYADLVYYMRTVPNLLVILDEAGDLDYSAFLELKALWNATEYTVGWYMMGADGLRKKIEGNIGRKKVGYTEIFSRFGGRYQRVTPDGDGNDKRFARQQTAAIAKANGVTDVQSLFARTQGSLRRIYIEIQKIKSQQS